MRPSLALSSALLVALAAGFVELAPARAALLDEPRVVSFRLDSPEAPRFSLLAPFRDASIERPGPLKLYTSGAWGSWTQSPWWKLSWRGPPTGMFGGLPRLLELDSFDAPEPSSSEPLALDIDPTDLDARDQGASIGSAVFDDPKMFSAPVDFSSPGGFATPGNTPSARTFAQPRFDSTGITLSSNGFDVIFKLPPRKPVVDWRCRRFPVQFLRYGNESDKIDLVRCDGSTAPGALDRLSIIARPPEVAHPEGELPDEPDKEAWEKRREWVDGVRMMHPRLLWALQRLADAFPRKAVYVYSGYRPFAEVHDGSGHQSLHASGRAIDLSFFHVPNAELFKACRELKDVGCGFYPHGKFVHVDVRRAHSGKASWIDASEPGEIARYVDSWPGVVDAPAAR